MCVLVLVAIKYTEGGQPLVFYTIELNIDDLVGNGKCVCASSGKQKVVSH